MAGILDFLGGAGSAFGDAASGVGGAIGDAGSALQNMAGSAVSAAQPAFSGVGNWLMGSGEYAAPEAADRRQAQINMLSKLGGTLLASGAYQTPDSRAKHLAKLGDIGSSYTADLLKQQQARLMGNQMRQQMLTMKLQADRVKLIQAAKATPEGRARLAQMMGLTSPDEVAGFDVPTILLVTQQAALKRATMSPEQRAQEAALRSAGLLTFGATPTAQPAAGGVTPATNDAAPAVGGVAPAAEARPKTLSDVYRANPDLFRKQLKEIGEANKVINPAKYYSDVERAKAEGKMLAGAEDNLRTSNSMISLVDEMIKDPGREFATGWSGTVMPFVPTSSARAYASKVRQLNGKAFLEAYKSLKGTGQITEKEGQKALEAISRAQDLLLSEEDHLAALKDLRKSTVEIRNALSKKMGIKTEQPPPSTTGYKVIQVR